MEKALDHHKTENLSNREFFHYYFPYYSAIETKYIKKLQKTKYDCLNTKV